MIKGVVQKISVNPQFGLTSFAIKGQDGWFSLGKDPATFKEGDSIQFETKQVGKYTYARDIAPWQDGGTTSGGNVSRVVEDASRSSNGSGNSWKGKGGSFRGGAGSAAAKDEYWANKEARDIAKEGEYALTQKRIEIQAARNAAIETAKAMWELDITPKPKAVKDQYDAFVALINELVDKYLADTSLRLSASERSEDQRTPIERSVDQGGRRVEESVAARQPDSNNGTWD